MSNKVVGLRRGDRKALCDVIEHGEDAVFCPSFLAQCLLALNDAVKELFDNAHCEECGDPIPNDEDIIWVEKMPYCRRCSGRLKVKCERQTSVGMRPGPHERTAACINPRPVAEAQRGGVMDAKRIAEIRGYCNRVMPVPGPWGEGWGKYLGELLDEVERLRGVAKRALPQWTVFHRMKDADESAEVLEKACAHCKDCILLCCDLCWVMGARAAVGPKRLAELGLPLDVPLGNSKGGLTCEGSCGP